MTTNFCIDTAPRDVDAAIPNSDMIKLQEAGMHAYKHVSGLITFYQNYIQMLAFQIKTVPKQMHPSPMSMQ